MRVQLYEYGPGKLRWVQNVKVCPCQRRTSGISEVVVSTRAVSEAHDVTGTPHGPLPVVVTQ